MVWLSVSVLTGSLTQIAGEGRVEVYFALQASLVSLVTVLWSGCSSLFVGRKALVFELGLDAGSCTLSWSG